MESTKKKAGRPKSEPRTGPLVLEDAQKRETILTEISADTAQELSEYAAWVRESAPTKMTPAEAVSKTVNFAVRDLFARDKRWHEAQANRRATTQHRRKPSGAICVGTGISLFSGVPDRARALRTPTAGCA